VAEKARLEAMPPRGYQPIDGLAAYNQAVQKLIFGADSQLLAEGRVVTAQALGGTGALKIGADYLKQLMPTATVYISDPSWENHRALFEAAGFPVDSYPYYDAATRGVNFDGMKAKLNTLPAGSIVVLHACCHNPTGADMSEAQWVETIAILRERGLIAFIDMAYQGFADGIAEDALALNLFAASGLQFFISSSFSKSFSLYGERVGALSIVTAANDESARVLSQDQARHPDQLLQPADPWRRCRRCGAFQPGTAKDVGGRTGRHARPDSHHARQPRREAEGARDEQGLFLCDPATRNVLLYRTLRRTGRPSAKRVRDLRGEHRSYLPGRAEHQEHRLRRRGHRGGSLERAWRDGQVRQRRRCCRAGVSALAKRPPRRRRRG
jgi:hypothetical protein